MGPRKLCTGDINTVSNFHLSLYEDNIKRWYGKKVEIENYA